MKTIENLNSRQAALLLSYVKDLAYKEKRAIYDALLEGAGLSNIPRPSLQACQEELSRRSLGRVEEEMAKRGYSFMDLADPLYPDLLKEIYDPPLGLFSKGKMEFFQKPMLAVVGARQATAYAYEVMDHLLPDLSQDFVIVSGLARGVDAYSHRLALQNKGQTLAVVGTGLDQAYPAENRDLQGQIAMEGLLVSELPFGRPPLKHHFPLRNRIIAGLSLGTLIIEARDRSGSLITAHLALEEGRSVFAVPGSILSDYSKGCHKLIDAGARLIHNPQQIKDDLAWMMGREK